MHTNSFKNYLSKIKHLRYEYVFGKQLNHLTHSAATHGCLRF